MLNAKRVRDRMAQLGLSQAELARRVGVRQQSIARLVSGEAVGSRYLHVVARELKTTAAYLSGETDDPTSDVPDDTLSSEERESLEQLRQLGPVQRDAVMQLIRTLTGEKVVPGMHTKRHAYRPEKRG